MDVRREIQVIGRRNHDAEQTIKRLRSEMEDWKKKSNDMQLELNELRAQYSELEKKVGPPRNVVFADFIISGGGEERTEPGPKLTKGRSQWKTDQTECQAGWTHRREQVSLVMRTVTMLTTKWIMMIWSGTWRASCWRLRGTGRSIGRWQRSWQCSR